ncbi:MAG: Gfo/Idh/MocA family oxidoreductase [candidate division KSB1 bacterium]|nr:Gfo/Idh/MocA family oxidoreductase [candidate division KSB1 bacterium]MDZ7364847.1 Gfo/Idh/MocA family oxidoreductase [candidate division KSB1 bacterium]MDZ7402950.1 Gfo/Idh/MocA family oxidoreductase [candidate division KSB1 bacterium]
MRKIRWGVLSTARIGLQKVIPAMQQAEHCEIIAIASRHLAAAQKAAAPLGIPKVHGSYDELLHDPDVEAVYNPLPNHLHVPWSIKAIEAGKHVLCEKPLATRVSELKQLIDVAKAHPQIKVMEAFMYRQHPQWVKTRELAQSGKIGEARLLHSFISFFNNDPNNVRNKPDMGGGALFDIGCYSVSIPRFIFGAEPQRVCAYIEYDPNFKIDRLVSAILDFGPRTSTLTCSTQLARHQSATIFGTAGRIDLEIPLNPPLDRPAKIFLRRDSGTEEILIEASNQFTIQGEALSLAIINDAPVAVPLEDSLANMKVIEALFESARENSWIAIKNPN